MGRRLDLQTDTPTFITKRKNATDKRKPKPRPITPYGAGQVSTSVGMGGGTL